MNLKLPKIPKEETRVICLGSAIFILILGITLLLKHYDNEEIRNNEELSISDIEAIERLQQQVKEDSAQRAHKYASTHISDSLFTFDPNHSDSVTLLKLGLSNWQVSNMMKYRKKGGIWRSADDFQRLYGLSKTDFNRLKPYIRIAAKDSRSKYISFSKYEQSTSQHNETFPYEKIEKYKEGATIDLEYADTTTLKRIPGIGSYYASKIVKYRERLGGFVSINQLNEIDGLPPNILRWFTLNYKPSIRKIRINHASFKELIRHPYLNYEQTKDIVNHVRQYGPIHKLKELKLYKDFTDKDFQRLEVYIQFD